jgi:WD40 repeat protein
VAARSWILHVACCLAPVLGCSAVAAQPKPPAGPNQKTTTPVRTDQYGDPFPGGVQMRLGTVRWQSRGQFLSFSPDGRTILVCDRDEVTTIDGESGKQLARTRLQRREQKTGHISVAFSDDCKTVAMFESDLKKVRFWEVASGKLLREFEAQADAAVSFVWSRDGSRIALGDYKERFYLWDAVTGARLELTDAHPGQRDHAVWMGFSPDSRFVAIAVADEFIQVWDLRKNQKVHQFKVRPGAMGFTPDGKSVACFAYGHNEIKFWNRATGEERPSIKLGSDHSGGVFDISPDGKLVAVKSHTGISLWSLPERKLLKSMAASAPEWLAFSPDGKKLACFNGRVLSMWDVATGRELNARPGHADAVEHAIFSPEGKILVSADRDDKVLIWWDAASGKQLRSMKLPQLCGTPSFSADGKLLVTGDSERGIRVWDVATGEESRLLTDRNWERVGFHDTIEYHISPDRTRLGALKHAEDRNGQSISRLWLWEPTTGRVIVRRSLPACYHGCFSPNCRLVALAVQEARPAGDGYENWLRIQDAISGRDQFKVSTRYIFHLAFSPDGKTVAAIRHKSVTSPDSTKTSTEVSDVPEICIWEVATGRERLRFVTEGSCSFAWASNSRLMATQDLDAACIWDGITGKKVLRIPLPDKDFPSGCLAFSPDAKTFAIGMADTTILTWDLSPQLARAGFRTRDLGLKELERLWADLASPDAGKAHHAIWKLVAAAGKAVPFLKTRMQPLADKDLKAFKQWIADLDSPSFVVRTAADKNLRRSLFDAELVMREALQEKPSLETRQRLESILGATFDEPCEGLAQPRALEALEHIGTDEARQLIERLATGAPHGRLTQEATASLERLVLRASGTP